MPIALITNNVVTDLVKTIPADAQYDLARRVAFSVRKNWVFNPEDGSFTDPNDTLDEE